MINIFLEGLIKIVGTISRDLPYDAVVGLLNIMNKVDAEGNKPKGTKLRDIILKYVQDNLKTIADSMEQQYEESNFDLSQNIKEDIIIAILAQYLAKDMQYAYDSEMDAKTVAVTIDTPNAAGTSGYNDEVARAGYKRQRTVNELNVLGLTEQMTFKGVLTFL